MEDGLKIMIVAGEASGDAHGAKLVRAFNEVEPETKFRFFGSAGPEMRKAGVDAVVEADSLSIVGLAEIGRALPMFIRASRVLKKAASHQKPDVVVLIDFPDFNLKLAKSLSKQGMKIVYYISPQLWAWRAYRIATISKYVDLLLAILPFEKEWYASKGVDHVEYVGNPLANEVYPIRSRGEFCSENGLDPERPIISLLPGSRHKEISRILPVMLDAAAIVARSIPEVQFVIPAASARSRIEINGMLVARELDDLVFKVVEGQTYDAVNASAAAAVTSGTATLETGILGTPMAIVYKTSSINYSLLEPLISVEHYGLINLIAGERVAKELIQHEFTPQILSDELFELLKPQANSAMRKKLQAATDKLGHGGASKRAAVAILKLLRGNIEA